MKLCLMNVIFLMLNTHGRAFAEATMIVAEAEFAKARHDEFNLLRLHLSLESDSSKECLLLQRLANANYVEWLNA